MKNTEATNEIVRSVLVRNGFTKNEVKNSLEALSPIANDKAAMVAYFRSTWWSAKDSEDLASEITNRIER